MPVIINPFKGTDPTAQAFADVGNAIFGNTGQAALRREQIVDAQRKNTETLNLMNAIKAAGGAQNLGADADAQSMALGAGISPQTFGGYGLLGSAIQNGAAARKTQDFQVGTGQSYDNTADAVKARLAETARQFDEKPIAAVDATGNPAFAPQGNTVGFTPMISADETKGTLIRQNWDNLDTLNQNQQAVLGAAKAPGAAQTPRNYVAPNGESFITYDGITDARTGQQLPSGGFIANAQGSAKDVGLSNSTKTSLQGSLVQAQQFHGLAQAMIGLADQHPEAFGLYGKVAGTVQSVAQAADTLVNQMGGGEAYRSALASAQQQLASNGASPDMLARFNPAIPAADTLGPILAYSAASAVANQTGRSVSDKELEMWGRIVGDPQSWLSSAQEIKSRVQLLDATVAYAEQINREALEKGVAVPDAGAVFAQAYSRAVNDIVNKNDQLLAPTAAPGAPAPAGGQAAPSPGQPVEIKNDADYEALPSGAEFIAPDGSHRRKP